MKRITLRQMLMIVILQLILLGGCASTADRSLSSQTLAVDQHWQGVKFNSLPAGYAHTSTSRSEDGVVINSEVFLHFYYLSQSKRITMQGVDRLSEEFELQGFQYLYDVDGSVIRLQGERRGGTLSVTMHHNGQQSEQQYDEFERLYAASVIDYYPVIQGLQPGPKYHFHIYDGESRRVVQVEQQILGREMWAEVDRPVYKVRTYYGGMELISWITDKGENIREQAMGGMFVSEAMREAEAKSYLTQSMLNKQESLLELSMIKSNLPIPYPMHSRFMTFRMKGLDQYRIAKDDFWQRCKKEQAALLCEIDAGRGAGYTLSDEQKRRYLADSVAIPASNPQLRQQLKQIVGEEGRDSEKVALILKWIERNIEQKMVDAFSALDVLNRRQAECQGHSYLFAAWMRASNIPARVVNGLVYTQQYQAFLYHTWVEIWLDGRWQSVDPTFGQRHTDATHIKLLEGDSPDALAPMASMVGRIGVELISVE